MHSIASIRRPAPASSGWWRPAPLAAGGDASLAGERAAFWALMAFTVVMLLAPQHHFPVLAPLRLALLSAGAAMAFLVLPFLLGRADARSRPWLPREAAPALGLAVLSVAMLAVSRLPGVSLALLTGLYLKSLLIFWLLGQVMVTRARLRRLAGLLVVCAAIIAATAIYNYLTGHYYGEDATTGVRRIMGYDTGLAANPNDLALLLCQLAPFAVALLLLHRGALSRLAFGGVVALCVVAVITTYSRGGFLTLLSLPLAYWLTSRRRSLLPVLFLPAAAAAVVAMLPDAYLGHMETIGSVESDATGSAQSRLRDLGLAARWVLWHPIGAGPGVDLHVLHELRGGRGELGVSVHNFFLQVAMDLGWIGLALVVLLCVRVLRAAAAARRTAADPELRALAQAVEISLVAFVVGGMFHPIAYHFYLYYFAGLAVALAGLRRREGAVHG